MTTQTQTKKEAKEEAKKQRIIIFDIQGRIIKGRYVDMGKTLIQIDVESDSQNVFKRGDHTNIHRHFLEDESDRRFIEDCEYDNLNLLQKWTGKYYLGLVLLVGAVWYLIS